MFNLLRYGVLFDEIIMLGKAILMAIFLPVIAVMTCLVVVFLRIIDGAACLLDVFKARTRMTHREENGK